MKKQLLQLEKSIEYLEKQRDKIFALQETYNESEFLGWKQETQNIIEDIFDEDKRHIRNFRKALKVPISLKNIQQEGKEAEDKRVGNIKLSNASEALRVIIDYIKSKKRYSNDMENNCTVKIFISHAHADHAYAEKIVQLLNDIGIPKNKNLIFCSSIPGYGIPIRKNIYEYLKREFTEKNLFVIFLLSENYYNSPACLNEMGATWVLSRNYQTILLPGFQYHNIRGAINPMEICIKLNEKGLEFKLNEFKDLIISEFGLPSIDQNIWESDRNKFIKQIKSFASKKKVLKTPVDNKQLQQQIGNPLKQTQTIQDFTKNRLKQQATLTQMSIILNERINEFDRYLGRQVKIVESLFTDMSTECTYMLDIFRFMEPENMFSAGEFGDIHLVFSTLPKRFIYHRKVSFYGYGNVIDANLEIDASSEITPYEYCININIIFLKNKEPQIIKGKSINFPENKKLHEWIDGVFMDIQEILESEDLKRR